MAMVEQVGDALLLARLATGEAWGRSAGRPSPGQHRQLRLELLAHLGHGAQKRVRDLLDDVELADLVWDGAEDGGDGLRVAG